MTCLEKNTSAACSEFRVDPAFFYFIVPTKLLSEYTNLIPLAWIKPKDVHQPLMSSSPLNHTREIPKYSLFSKQSVIWVLGTQYHFALWTHFLFATLLANVDIAISRVKFFHFNKGKGSLSYKPFFPSSCWQIWSKDRNADHLPARLNLYISKNGNTQLWW